MNEIHNEIAKHLGRGCDGSAAMRGWSARQGAAAAANRPDRGVSLAGRVQPACGPAKAAEDQTPPEHVPPIPLSTDRHSLVRLVILWSTMGLPIGHVMSRMDWARVFKPFSRINTPLKNKAPLKQKNPPNITPPPPPPISPNYNGQELQIHLMGNMAGAIFVINIFTEEKN